MRDLIRREELKEALFIKFGNQLPNGIFDEIDKAPVIDTSDLISKSDLLRRIDEERKYLIERGLTGAEHVITKAIRDLIDTDPEEV